MKPYILTYTGRRFFFDDPLPGICKEDIAHSLSQLCRWTGHTREFYSVAQHSVIISRLSNHPLYALLHDASEAYLNDLNKPFKVAMASEGSETYERYETLIQEAIFEWFNVPGWSLGEVAAEVKNWDKRVAVWEANQLLPLHDGEVQMYEGTKPAFSGYLEVWSTRVAELTFLDRLKELIDGIHPDVP